MCADRGPAGGRVRQRGITLVELIMFIVIVGVGIAGILSVMNVVVRASADPVVRKQSIAMAEAILEEVMTKEYSNPAGGFTETDTVNCSNRALYDDVDDFACFGGTPSTAVIKGTDTLGAASTPLLANFKATVAVAATTISGIAMKQVTVTVTDPSGTAYSLSAYKANY